MNKATRFAAFVAGAAVGAVVITALGLSAAGELLQQQTAKYGSGKSDDVALDIVMVLAALGAGLGFAVAGLIMRIAGRFAQHDEGSRRAIDADPQANFER